MAPSAKQKITCFECGSSYRVDMSKVPPDRKALKCLNCGKAIPILDRVLKDKDGKAPVAAQAAPEAPKAAAAPAETGAWEALVHDPAPPAPEEGESGETWLAIYGDMMSILLLFFVLLFAMSTIDKQKFQSVIEAVSQALGGSIKYVEQPVPGAGAPSKLDILKGKVTKEQDRMQGLRKQLGDLVRRDEVQNAFAVKDENDGLVIIAQDLAMFDSGSAQIKEGIRPFLLQLGSMLKNVTNDIVIEGHTDDVPINTPQFASNWELSVARATNVLHFLVEKSGLSPDRLSAAGYAFYRPRHPFSGADAGKNRRIEIVIKKRYSDQFAEDLAQTGTNGAGGATGRR